MKENSRKNWLVAAAFVGKDPKRVSDLMELFFSKDNREIQVCSQVVSEVSDAYPELILPYLPKMILHLKTNPIDAFKRITIRFCQSVTIPEEVEGELFEHGIAFLKSAEAPIAVKAYAITALSRLCEKYPELAAELIPHIELLLEEKPTPAVANRGEKELKKLRRLIKG